MGKGFSITDEGSLIDAKAARAAGYLFGYIRARKTASGSTASAKDDQYISQNRTALAAAGLPFGVFMDFDWRPGVDGSGVVQATEFAGQCRQDDLLPPGIRLWGITGVTISDWHAFTRLLAEVVYYLDIKVHRRPVIWANEAQIKAITSAMAGLSLDQRTLLSGCWWGVISWKDSIPVLASPWTKFPFHEYTNHVSQVPGAINVALMHWPGSGAQLSTWAKNPTMDNLPAWGAVEPEDPPEDPGDPEVPPETQPKTLDDIYAILEKLAAHLGVK